MKDFNNIMKDSLLKREAALAKFKAKREAFILAKEQITRDIIEAKVLYKKTMEQLPGNGFIL